MQIVTYVDEKLFEWPKNRKEKEWKLGFLGRVESIPN